jgi:uncharacterized protein
MKKIIILILMLIGMNNVTFSQDSLKIKEIQKMMKIMDMDKTMNQMYDGMKAGMMQNIKKQGLDSIKISEFYDFMVVEMKLIMKDYENDVLNIYAKHYTIEEIRDMNLFYQSSTGKKMLQKMPEIIKETMGVMYSKYFPEMMEKMKKKMEEDFKLPKK